VDSPLEAEPGAELLQSAGLFDTGHSLKPPRPSAPPFCMLADPDSSFILLCFLSPAQAGPALATAAIANPRTTFLITSSSETGVFWLRRTVNERSKLWFLEEAVRLETGLG
jgi:hypothetical protein